MLRHEVSRDIMLATAGYLNRKEDYMKFKEDLKNEIQEDLTTILNSYTNLIDSFIEKSILDYMTENKISIQEMKIKCHADFDRDNLKTTYYYDDIVIIEYQKSKMYANQLPTRSLLYFDYHKINGVIKNYKDDLIEF